MRELQNNLEVEENLGVVFFLQVHLLSLFSWIKGFTSFSHGGRKHNTARQNLNQGSADCQFDLFKDLWNG